MIEWAKTISCYCPFKQTYSIPSRRPRCDSWGHYSAYLQQPFSSAPLRQLGTLLVKAYLQHHSWGHFWFKHTYNSTVRETMG
jgi:hypothetical protein